jgi:hypothetical protein
MEVVDRTAAVADAQGSAGGKGDMEIVRRLARGFLQ